MSHSDVCLQCRVLVVVEQLHHVETDLRFECVEPFSVVGRHVAGHQETRPQRPLDAE